MSDKTARLTVVGSSVRFARSATRHRIPKDSIRYVVANYRLRWEERPPPNGAGARSTRIVYLGKDTSGHVLEIMAIEGDRGELLVIHAMKMREKYRNRYEEAGDEQVQDS